jgi:mRNA interferase MazF
LVGIIAERELLRRNEALQCGGRCVSLVSHQRPPDRRDFRIPTGVARKGASRRYVRPMSIQYHPQLGEALWCEYDGLAPEMIKRRLAVVLTPKACHRSRIATVVPVSTTPPDVIRPWHVCLSRDPLPQGGAADVWVKCDMVNVVSFARLSNYHYRWNGRREYRKLHVSIDDLRRIREGVLASFGHPW